MKRIFHLSWVVLLTLSYLFIPLSNYGPQLEIYALDVGQGDSTLIVTPLKHRILIDGGRDNSVIEKIDEIIPFWDRQIDMVMLTHPDADHITGLVSISSRYKVDRVFITPVEVESEVHQVFMQEVARWKVETDLFVRGTVINTIDGVTLNGLWPNSESIKSGDANSNSQVGVIKYGFFSGLLTGDIDTEVANQLNKYNDFSDINYLKVPHHGSKYNLAPEHLKKLLPEVSTISVGKDNTYGHPSKETVDSLEQLNSAVYQTSVDGTIGIIVNLSGISVSSE